MKNEKIAILYSESITKAALGSTRTLLDLSEMLSSIYTVRAFSLGKKAAIIEKNKIIEEVFHSSVSSESRNKLIRAVDYIFLLLFKKQFSYYSMNSNKAIFKAVKNFSPNIIITLGRNLSELTISLGKAVPNAITISITDDFRVVENSLSIQKAALQKRKEKRLQQNS